MDNFKPLFDGEEGSQEELAVYRAETEYKLSHKEKVNRILKFISENNISSEEMKIFNKILGDHKILDKLVFVWDGSYRSNRIYYKKFIAGKENNFHIENWWLYKNHNHKCKAMTMMENINYIKNNYEIIFIHLITDDESQKDIYDRILYRSCNTGMDYEPEFIINPSELTKVPILSTDEGFDDILIKK